MSPAGVKVYLVRFPVQRNISAKQTLEDNIHDPQTRKRESQAGESSKRTARPSARVKRKNPPSTGAWPSAQQALAALGL